MSQLKDFTVDYDQVEANAKGGYFFEIYKNQIPSRGDKMTVIMGYTPFDSDDVIAKLLQSVDGVKWQEIEDSEVSIDNTVNSHAWNIAGYTPGLFIAVYLDPGTSTSGQVVEIKYLG